MFSFSAMFGASVRSRAGSSFNLISRGRSASARGTGASFSLAPCFSSGIVLSGTIGYLVVGFM